MEPALLLNLFFLFQARNTTENAESSNPERERPRRVPIPMSEDPESTSQIEDQELLDHVMGPDLQNEESFDDHNLSERISAPFTAGETSAQSESPFDAMRRLQYIYARLSHTETNEEEPRPSSSRPRRKLYWHCVRSASESSQSESSPNSLSQPGPSQPGPSQPGPSQPCGSNCTAAYRTPCTTTPVYHKLKKKDNKRESSTTTEESETNISNESVKRVKREEPGPSNKTKPPIGCRLNKSRKTEPKRLVNYVGPCCSSTTTAESTATSDPQSRIPVTGENPTTSSSEPARGGTNALALHRALRLAKLNVAKCRRSSQPDGSRPNPRCNHAGRRQRSVPNLVYKRTDRGFADRGPLSSMAPPTCPMNDRFIREDMDMTPQNVLRSICRVEDYIRQLHNEPQVRFYRGPPNYHASTISAERKILLRLYSIRADLQRMGKFH